MAAIEMAPSAEDALPATKRLNLIHVLKFILDEHRSFFDETNDHLVSGEEALAKLVERVNRMLDENHNITVGYLKNYFRDHPDIAKQIFLSDPPIGGRSHKSKRSKRSNKSRKTRKSRKSRK